MVFSFTIITCFISILSHVWSYSFRLLMHHLMLTKPFLAVSIPCVISCLFSSPNHVLCILPGTMDALNMIQLPSSSVQLLWGTISWFLSDYLLLILSTTSPTPQLTCSCLSMSNVPFSSLQQHFTVLLIIPLADCISQAHNQTRSHFCSWSFSTSLKFPGTTE